MILFETDRLLVKSLVLEDETDFAELLTDPRILELIPQKVFTPSQVSERFNKNLNLDLKAIQHTQCACGIVEKGKAEMIGLCLFLINEAHENELGYRFKVKHWGKGYGTEITKGMLDFYFTVLNIDKVVADVNTENTGSVKILSKFMKPVNEFFNERDNCYDRTYEIERKNWVADSI